MVGTGWGISFCLRTNRRLTHSCHFAGVPFLVYTLSSFQSGQAFAVKSSIIQESLISGCGLGHKIAQNDWIYSFLLVLICVAWHECISLCTLFISSSHAKRISGRKQQNSWWKNLIGPKEYIQQATGSLPDFVRLLWLHVKYIFGNFLLIFTPNSVEVGNK